MYLQARGRSRSLSVGGGFSWPSRGVCQDKIFIKISKKLHEVKKMLQLKVTKA